MEVESDQLNQSLKSFRSIGTDGFNHDLVTKLRPQCHDCNDAFSIDTDSIRSAHFDFGFESLSQSDKFGGCTSMKTRFIGNLDRLTDFTHAGFPELSSASSQMILPIIPE